MTIIDKFTEEFLKALKEADVVLFSLFFNRHSFFEKGLAYYIEYTNVNNTKVEFVFGPPEWNIEMIVYTSTGKFAFKDLLNIPEINRWVTNNRYKQEDVRNIKNELLWFIKLLKVSLPYVE
jgi:hypothetical protein